MTVRVCPCCGHVKADEPTHDPDARECRNCQWWAGERWVLRSDYHGACHALPMHSIMETKPTDGKRCALWSKDDDADSESALSAAGPWVMDLESVPRAELVLVASSGGGVAIAMARANFNPVRWRVYDNAVSADDIIAWAEIRPPRA